MQLDFVRHGLAEDPQPGQPDSDRPLTPKGIRRTTQVARRLKLLGWRWDMVLTSPLLRADQTARILLQEELTPEVQVFPALAPGGFFGELITWHQGHAQMRTVAVVGHQPDLCEWVSAYTWGLGERLAIDLKKAGLASVRFPEGSIEPEAEILVALLSPRILLAKRSA